MNKKIPISLAIAIAIVAMTITFSITMVISMKMFDSTVSSVKEKEAMYGKIAEIDRDVRDNYSGEINDTTLYDTMGAGYLAGIGDKYSRYYTAQQYATYLNEKAGKLMGIGVDIVKDATGYARIIQVYADSPAAEAGLTRGSYIETIDGTDLKALSLDAMKALLKGEEGTVTTIVYMTADFTSETSVDLSRRTYTVPSVSSEMVGSTGYLRIATFNSATPAEFDAKLQEAMAAGVTGLVIDVRNNSSTDLDDMLRVLDVLCAGADVASEQYKNGSVETLPRTSDDTSVTLPIVVVTNSSTASAAELFSVTLRDVNGAKIVGDKTAGRGSIQKIFEQQDGSALGITVATMVPAHSDSFEGTGLVPDFEVSLSPTEEANWYALTTADDPQLLKAFEMVDSLNGIVSQTSSSSVPTDGATTDDAGTDGAAADGTAADDAGADSTAADSPTA